MITDELKSVGYYQNNKKLFNEKYNKIWRSIAGSKYIGNCSFLFQEFYKEWKANHKEEKPAYNDFFRFYLSHVNRNTSYPNDAEKPDCTEYGRSIADLVKLAEHYMGLCNDWNISLDKYFDDIVNHAIIETFDGQCREAKVREVYIQNGFTIERTNKHWDASLGVDLIVRNKKNEICEYVQVKPLSTFLGDTNESLLEDRKYFFRKEEEKKIECEKNNLPYFKTKFILYNKRYPEKWCSLNGKKGFYLDELCNEDGTAKHKIEEFSYI